MAKFRVLFGLTMVFGLADPAVSQAAVMKLLAEGQITSTVQDTTDYFGLGGQISGGVPYSLAFLYDNQVGTVSGSGGTHIGGFFFDFNASSSNPLSAPRLVGLSFTINGVELDVDASAFTQHSTSQHFFGDTAVLGSTRVPPNGFASSRFEGTTAFSGSDGLGNSASASFSASFVNTGEQRSDVQAIPQGNPFLNDFSFLLNGTASISVMLLAADGSTAIDIGGGSLGISRLTQTAADVPVPAALPLLLTGFLGLGAIKRKKRSQVRKERGNESFR